ncbi:hypothetical protein EK904_012702 [Melospiza melodia maxima]|nr:hypothetical protein EK904_012702 [Melospiza melodia maxima]
MLGIRGEAVTVCCEQREGKGRYRGGNHHPLLLICSSKKFNSPASPQCGLWHGVHPSKGFMREIPSTHSSLGLCLALLMLNTSQSSQKGLGWGSRTSLKDTGTPGSSGDTGSPSCPEAHTPKQAKFTHFLIIECIHFPGSLCWCIFQEQPPQLLCCCALKQLENREERKFAQLLKGSLQVTSMKFPSDFALRRSVPAKARFPAACSVTTLASLIRAQEIVKASQRQS